MAKRLESLLYVFLYLVIYVFSQILAIVVIPFCNTLLKLINGNTNLDSLVMYFLKAVNRVDKGSVMVLVASMIISVLLFMWVMRIRNRPWGKAILNKSLGAREITAAFLLAYGLNVIAIEISSLEFFNKFTTEYNSTISSIVTGDVFVIFLIIGILAPIFEELMYRGVILSEFMSGWNFLFANILQALVFGIMHMNVIQGTYAAAIGFILGFSYKMTRSIYMTMLTHFLFNASNLLISDYISSFFYLPYFITSGVVAIVLAFILISKLFRSRNKIYGS